jgi:putative phosphoesterase
MKVGILSDIHGNHYALEAALKDAKQKGVEKLLILGDIVGYYYCPDLILELLSDWDYEIIKGNHEELLEKVYKGAIDAEEVKKKYGSGHQEALKKLSFKTLQWLFNLPEHKVIIIDGITFQLNHGSPTSIDEYIYPDTSTEQLERCNSELYDFVLIGHSHYAFSYKCSNSILINCGSVGQSRQKGGIAYWAIVNTHDKSYSINTTPYDVTNLLQEVRKTDPDVDYSYNILLR